MLEKVKGGYKVKREHGPGYLSKKPLSKRRAIAQLAAEHISKVRAARKSKKGK